MGIELLLLAGVAVFVLARLFSVLGKQKGAPPPSFRTPEQKQRPQPVLVHSDNDDQSDEESEESLSDLQKISRLDPEFSQREFVKGAKAAYEMIVTSFAKGDRSSLQMLLTDDVYAD